MNEVSKHTLNILRRTLGYGILVTSVSLIAIAIYVLENRADLNIWHEVDLDEESCAPQSRRRESVVAQNKNDRGVDGDQESCAPQPRRREIVVATAQILIEEVDLDRKVAPHNPGRESVVAQNK